MKVGMLTQWFSPEPGGGLVPTAIARELVRRKHDVKVLTGFPNYPTGAIYPGYKQTWNHREVIEGADVRRVPLYPSHDDRAAQRIGNYMSFASSAGLHVQRHLGDSDAVWVYNSPAPVGLVAARLARRSRIPYLLHVMDVWPDSVLDSGMLPGRLNDVAERALTRMVNRGYSSASRIGVTSPGQIDLLVERGVPRDKLAYLPLSADEDLFFPRQKDRSLLPEPARNADLVLMYAGAIGHVQDLQTAVRAVAEIGDDRVHLVMVGGGVAEQSLRSIATDAPNVHFVGRRPSEAMGDLTAAADVHLVALADTPLMRRTMPSKLVSIAASGRAVVATCAGDAADAVRHSRGGLAVAPGDVDGLRNALLELSRSPEDVQRMGAQGRVFYQQEWARSVTMDRVEESLREIAG